MYRIVFAVVFAISVAAGSTGPATAHTIGRHPPSATSAATQPTAHHPSTPPSDPGAAYLRAFDSVAGAFANDSSVGRVIGAGIGLVVGCPLGALTGGLIFIPTVVLTPIGIIGGCIVGASFLTFVGGAIGALVSGSPAIVNAIQQQYRSLHSKHLIAAVLRSHRMPHSK